MERKNDGPNGKRPHGLVVFFLLVLSSAGMLGALEGKVVLENDRWVVGQRFNLDLLILTTDALSLRLMPMETPDALTLLAGPLIRPSYWVDEKQTTVSGTRITLTYRVDRSGLVNLGPFHVKQGEAELLIPSLSLAFLQPDESNRKFPLQSRWIVSSSPYYVGKPILLRLQLRNLDSIPTPQEIDISAPPRSILERVVGGGDIEITSWGGEKMFHIPAGSWILIPTSPGAMTLNPSRFQLDGLPRSTPELRLNVLAAPVGLEESRAIGDFTYDIQLDHQSPEVRIRQVLKGRGNFPYLVLPEVSAEDLQLLIKEESNEYRLAGEDYQGQRQILWRFLPQKTGKLSIKVPGLRWFDTSRQRVVTQPDKTLNVEITSLDSPGALGKKPKVSLLSTEELQEYYPFILWEMPWVFFLLIPGIVALIVGLRKRKLSQLTLLLLFSGVFLSFYFQREIPQEWQSAYVGFENGNTARAQEEVLNLLQLYPQDPALWHNLGVIQFSAGQVSEAIFSLRTSLSKRGTAKTQVFLDAIETQEDLSEQPSLGSGLSQDFLVGILVLSLNLFLYFLGFWLANPRPYRWIAMILFGIISLFSLGLQGYQWTVSLSPWAVVGPSDGPIKRVPGDLAEDWLVLKRGTVVRILGRSESYLQVQTGYGLEGWVRVGSYREYTP